MSNKEKKAVSVPRGTPPSTVTEAEENLNRILSGQKAEDVEPPKPMEESRGSYIPSPSQVPPPKPTPSILGTVQLEGELVDLELSYIDVQENEFSVLFVLPPDSRLGVKLKQSTSFVIDCAHVNRQKVTYVGAPMKFPRADVHLFFLLKEEGEPYPGM